MEKLCVSYETAAQMLDFTDGQVIARLVRQNLLKPCYPSGTRTPRILVTDLEAYVKNCKPQQEQQEPEPCPSKRKDRPIGGLPIKTQMEAANELAKVLAPKTTAKQNS